MSIFPLPLNHHWKTALYFSFHESNLTAKHTFMRKLRLLSFCIISILFITVSCTKEGPEGPVGASGAQGPAGLQGPAGPAGPAGPVGTTNVTYSAWYTTVAADWTAIGGPPNWEEYRFSRAAPAVTQTVIDNGLVLCYMKNWPFDNGAGGVGRSADVAQLPYLADVVFMDYYDYNIQAAGTIRFMYKSQFAWTLATMAGITYRYIVIPGSIAGGKTTYGGRTAEELKTLPYEQVVQILNIPAEGTNIQ